MSHDASHEGAAHDGAPAKLVYMANQIGKFWQSQDQAKAPTAIAEHIKKFWDPRMRKRIFAHLDAGGAGLDPAVRLAIEQLKAAATSRK